MTSAFCSRVDRLGLLDLEISMHVVVLGDMSQDLLLIFLIQEFGLDFIRRRPSLKTVSWTRQGDKHEPRNFFSNIFAQPFMACPIIDAVWINHLR